MSSNLIITRDSGLQPAGQYNNITPQPAWLRAIANVLSYIFHPVFVPVYVVYFLMYVYPFLFVGYEERSKFMMLSHAALMYTFFPLVTVLLLRALNFIGSIKLKSQRDRIIPYIASGIWYFWVWNVWRNQEAFPHEMVVFAFAVFIASSIGFIFNIYMKVSMHAIALSTAVCFLCSLGLLYPVGLGIYLSIALFITGLVCTSRLILGDHSLKQIYWGLFIGIMAIAIAYITQ